MRKTVCTICIAFLAISCNNASTNTEEPATAENQQPNNATPAVEEYCYRAEIASVADPKIVDVEDLKLTIKGL